PRGSWAALPAEKVWMPPSGRRRQPARRHSHRDGSVTCLCGTVRPREGSLMQVSVMMQTQIITATPDMALADVPRLMRANHIRHVRVVSGKRLVGIITDRDVREASPSPTTTLTKGEIRAQMAET